MQELHVHLILTDPFLEKKEVYAVNMRIARKQNSFRSTFCGSYVLW